MITVTDSGRIAVAEEPETRLVPSPAGQHRTNPAGIGSPGPPARTLGARIIMLGIRPTSGR